MNNQNLKDANGPPQSTLDGSGNPANWNRQMKKTASERKMITRYVDSYFLSPYSSKFGKRLLNSFKKHLVMYEKKLGELSRASIVDSQKEIHERTKVALKCIIDDMTEFILTFPRDAVDFNTLPLRVKKLLDDIIGVIKYLSSDEQEAVTKNKRTKSTWDKLEKNYQLYVSYPLVRDILISSLLIENLSLDEELSKKISSFDSDQLDNYFKGFFRKRLFARLYQNRQTKEKNELYHLKMILQNDDIKHSFELLKKKNTVRRETKINGIVIVLLEILFIFV